MGACRTYGRREEIITRYITGKDASEKVITRKYRLGGQLRKENDYGWNENDRTYIWYGHRKHG